MYSSLDKIDAVAKSPLRYVQTDHRSAEAMLDSPEVSTLFALTRILAPRHHADIQGVSPTIIYATSHDEVPEWLREVLAVTGASHQVAGGAAVTFPPEDMSAGELADRAFRGLAGRVSRRVGLTDMATVLRALEAETLAVLPNQDEDEAGYWTRVLELAAVTCEVMRSRGGGRWEIHHHTDVPFGFIRGRSGGELVLATNRAHRFIADGKAESMFLLLAADFEGNAAAHADPDLPVMPNLRSRREAVACDLTWRPLYEGAPDDDGFPVVVYGHDTAETFGAFQVGRGRDLEALDREALANLSGQDVSSDTVEVEGVSLLAVSGSYYAAEKLLDRDFMRKLHRELGEDILAVGVPRRGLMFVTAVRRADKRELLVLQAATRHEAKTTRAISEAILLVKDGEVAGHVEITPPPGPEAAAADANATPATADADATPSLDDASSLPSKLSWWRRLFGRK